MNVAELKAEPPGGLWVHVSEPAMNGGANFTTLMKHLASSGLCPTFTALKDSHTRSCVLFLPDSGAVQSTRVTLMKCISWNVQLELSRAVAQNRRRGGDAH